MVEKRQRAPVAGGSAAVCRTLAADRRDNTLADEDGTADLVSAARRTGIAGRDLGRVHRLRPVHARGGRFPLPGNASWITDQSLDADGGGLI
jgi:hypothetical protein